MQLMTLLVDEKVAEIIGENNLGSLIYKVRRYENEEELIEDALGILDNDMPVLAVFDRAWERWPEIKKEITKRGLNRFLFEFIDSVELEIVKKFIDPISVIVAKYSALLNFMAYKAISVSKIDKPIDRRTLLRRPYRALLEYLSAPILLNEDICRNWKYCKNCIASCPLNAISGKPPKVNLDACNGCGLCTSSCPFGLLFMPQYNLKSYEYFLSTIRERLDKKPAYIFISCRDSLPKVRDELLGFLQKDKVKYPTFFISVDCPGWFTQGHMLASLMQGFIPIIYCDKDTFEKCGGLNKLKEWSKELSAIAEIRVADDIHSTVKILEEKPNISVLENVGTLHQDRSSVLKLFRSYNIDEVKLSVPLIGIVNVNDEKCLLCDACTNSCPFSALRLRNEGDKRYLEFSQNRCTACGICQEICPYGAIRLEYGYRKSYDGVWIPLAEDEIARCRLCGKPIGSTKHLKALERKLRESGADPWVLESLWLCQECKIKMLIERKIHEAENKRS